MEADIYKVIAFASLMLAICGILILCIWDLFKKIEQMRKEQFVKDELIPLLKKEAVSLTYQSLDIIPEKLLEIKSEIEEGSYNRTEVNSR